MAEQNRSLTTLQAYKTPSPKKSLAIQEMLIFAQLVVKHFILRINQHERLYIQALHLFARN
jgi:hypothetical protein